MERSLFGSVVPRDQVSAPEADELFRLFRDYYRKVDRPTFDRDLEEKDKVLLLRDAGGRIQGFTTLLTMDVRLSGRRVRAIFNGNTIIRREFWGDQELVRTWCAHMAGLYQREPGVPLYWYLICSGFRTYLFLPLFFREFHPCLGRRGPRFERNLLELLGRLKFPDEYEDGIVRPREPRECLRPELAVPAGRRLRNPHVRHFLEANPGYLRGDELTCLAEFSPDNTLRAAREAFDRPGALAC